uniref:S1 motif domain-containing protein n=1 Tax=Davidia involucrata TaxID=16924 RepID=A0A5B6YX22_DAVIN
MGRKSNPEMSYLEIEKSFYKKKGKSINNEIEEVPFDGSKEGQLSNLPNGLNLVRPVPKKGVKFEGNKKPIVSQVKKPSQQVGKTVDNTKGSIPNVILRRPTTFDDDDVGTEKSSKLKIKPNLLLRMGKEQTKEKFSDITLLKKPQPSSINSNLDKIQEPSGDAKPKVTDEIEEISLKPAFVLTKATNDLTLLNKPEQMDLDSNVNQEKESSDDHIGLSSGDNLKDSSVKGVNSSIQRVNEFNESLETGDASPSGDAMVQDDSATGLQPLELSDIGSAEKSTAINEPLETKLVDSNVKFSVEAALQGKPKRLDQAVEGTSDFSREDTVLVNPGSYGSAVELENFLAPSPIKEYEDTDWARAEDLVKTGGREEVELISSSTRGFVVSFGSLVGFLPYRNLAARWKFLAFESWLRRKGLNPSMYKQNLGIIGSYEVMNKTSSLDSSLVPEMNQKVEVEISPDMKLEDLLRIYDQEKLKFLSSFVGQKIKVTVVLADRKSRRLIFSIKPKEKEELVEKKRSLMARLGVGDVVKCRIKKITYFGIFVEVEGVPALIHQSEVSWDSTLDPAYFKVGQIVEAKVHQLDFSLERIFLSLKEITPDPLNEALEAVIGDHDSLDVKLEAAEADAEWADVETLVKELQQFEGIQSVLKGRFFLSPGLAPTFQVYMASMFENQYKLLARSGNRVQEVIVQTSLGKEEMKSAILTCTNRVG